MEVSKVEDNGNVIKEVSSSLSSASSEFEKDVGSAHVIKKSSSMEAEECSRMISQSSSDVKDSEMRENTEGSGEIKQEELKLTLQEIISEIEENIQGKEECTKEQDKNESEAYTIEELPILEKNEEIDEDNETSFQKQTYYKVDRQTSTTSLEDQQRESSAASLLGFLSRGDVGKRPHSLPANLAHLWQSLKIANELNQSLAAANSALNGDDSEAVNTNYLGLNIQQQLGHPIRYEEQFRLWNCLVPKRSDIKAKCKYFFGICNEPSHATEHASV